MTTEPAAAKTSEDRKGKSSGKDMPFLEHLEELRRVLIQSSLVVVVLAIGAWFISKPVLEIITKPAGQLVFLGPTEAFTLRIKVALLTGFFIAFPFIFYKIWTFVAPGLFKDERYILAIVVVGSSFLFTVGACFGYFILIPIALKFLLGFGTDFLEPMISAGNYFGFATRICIALGVVFQLPLVVSLSTWAGFVDPRWLLRNWRYAILGIALTSALLTPPDIASQALMGLPILGLYFLSAFLSLFIEKKKKAKDRSAKKESEAE